MQSAGLGQENRVRRKRYYKHVCTAKSNTRRKYQIRAKNRAKHSYVSERLRSRKRNEPVGRFYYNSSSVTMRVFDSQ